ncbi:amidase [Rubrivivax gelatinosus]|nr:amidase [Rubrivivax gelatinosus]
MRHDEYLRHDASALAERVRRGEVSPPELLALARAQAERVQPLLNCITRPLPELAAAQLARPPAGALAGVPFVVKDSVADVAGVPTSYGSRAFERVVPTMHAAVLRRLLDAGAVVFAKTNLPELGLKGVSDSRRFGPVGNPWDPARNAGGSSGGSAAAVAAGVVPMAGGNDGGGSLRIPAAACGLFALKPSRGRISNGPGLGEVWFGACSEGVISRSVRDSALALDILCGPEPGDPFAAAAPAEPFVAALKRPLPRLRVAFSTASPLGTPVDSQAVAAVVAAARRLEALGHRVEEKAPAIDGAAVASCYLALYAAQIPAVIAWARSQGAVDSDFEPLTRVMAAYGRGFGASALTLSLGQWNVFARTLAAFFGQHEVWLTPTLAQPALLHGALAPKPAEAWASSMLIATGLLGPLARLGLLGATVERLFIQNLAPYPFTQLANLAGVPAMSLPLHWTPEGLPLGVQAVGRVGDEATLLQLAAELEADSPWFDRLAPIARGAG